MSAWLSVFGVSLRTLCARHVHHVVQGRLVHRQVLSPQIVIFRGFSSSLSETIKYEELKDLLKKESTFLIDVREPWEVKEYGVIRDSFNIPLGDLVQALQMDPKDFEEKYQTKMPIKSDSLVFSCLAGIRSKKALDTAVSLGFTSVQHYAGGLDDWAKHELPEKKP